MNSKLKILLLSFSMSFYSLSYAEWTYEYSRFVGKWVVSDGEQEIRYNKEKSAKKAAKVLNKNEKKTEGVWNDGSEYCNDPLNEC